MSRHQQGFLRKETRVSGDVWVYRYYCIREDGRRVEHTHCIGKVLNFPSKAKALAEVERTELRKQINKPDFKSLNVTFGMLAQGYIDHELGPQEHRNRPRSHTTVATYEMYLRRHIRPHWDGHIATTIKPLAVESWLQKLKRTEGLSNPTCNHLKQLMGLVFKFGRKHDFIPKGCNPMSEVECSTESDYVPRVIKPEEAFAIWQRLREPVSSLVLLVTMTGLRCSEALGLRWGDVKGEEGVIIVQRSWTMDKIGKPKSKSSKAPVPCIPALSQHLAKLRSQSLYARDEDYLFPSTRNKGKTPRSGSILVQDHLRRAALEAGVIKPGEGLGLHCLRHSLATFLVAQGRDVKTVQNMLRHAKSTTTLDIYAHGRNQDSLDAQGDIWKEFWKSAPTETAVVQ
jgi:integrase